MELSEEEKKAIEYFKWEIDFFHANTQLASEYYAQTLLNLIEKQQEEIEELKEKEKNLIFQLKDEEKELIEVTDKIREKINYYRKYCGYDGVTSIGNTQLKELEELLEEN